MGLLESKLSGKIAEVDITKQTCALLLGVSGTDMSRWLTCVKPIPSPEAIRLDQMLNDLLRIREIIFPLRLPLQDVSALKALLQKFRDNGLDRIVDRETLDELRREISVIQSL
jgi:hypothetical protein